jgi:hypothetical protein
VDGVSLITGLYVNHVELLGSVMKVSYAINASLLSSKIPLTIGLSISDSF